MANDVLAAVEPVVDALLAVGARYRIGGSVASSALGVPRSTLDVDLACDLAMAQAERFAAHLRASYYVDLDMIRGAIRRQSSFNVIHYATMLKVDVFVRRSRPFEDVAFERSVQRTIDSANDAREFEVTTPEDIVLHKLEWYRLGGEVSDRQWHDIVGVLAVQRDTLDTDYLRHWAAELGVSDLLQRAMATLS